MAGQIVRSYAPPKAKSFPLTVGRSDLDGIGTIEIDNGSALTLSVTADGQLVRTVTPYTTRFCINTGGLWGETQITANGASIQATDSVTIACYGRLVIPPLPPSFGVSSWGAGADPASLVQIGVGDQLLAWQVRQFYLLLTGQMAGQITQFAGNVELRQSDLVLYSKNVPANVKKFLVGNGNQLQIYADDGTTLLASLDENGRWTVPATGASAKPLLNPVPLNPPVLTTLTGTGNKASTAFTVNGLPSSAVLAALLVDWTTPTVGGTIILYHDTLSTVPGLIARTNTPFNAGDTGGLMAVAAGATNQLAYNVGGLGAGDNWTAQVYAQAYAEAS